MNSESPFRKYMGRPESVAWQASLIFYQIHIYPEASNEKETSVRWQIQEEIYNWLSSMFNKLDLSAWDNIRKTVGKTNPTKEYSR